ncbi:MAG: helix-turn-helix transcriptional regulator [Armatimonadota bacterium]|nr:helix-turn-helix transcriptional regulator [Armatimonadota bacterium]MCX7777932.1 helix-turn-helix transcriptional regulator [Armatimonadota bacterium]MDW8025635.1 helix-turn-helix transcriptional regulator [Armatimonadota bacterium]
MSNGEGHPSTDRRGKQARSEHSGRKRFYAISVVARMLNLHPQTIRLYERLGLIKPSRDRHGKRMYDDEDIERIRKIQHLTQQMGVNLAGVEIILRLRERISELEGELKQLKGNFEEQVEQRAKVLALQLLDWLRYQENIKASVSLKMLAESPLIRAGDWEALSELFEQFITRKRLENEVPEA